MASPRASEATAQPLSESIFSVPSEPVHITEELFDEPGYLLLNPDVKQAVEAGVVESGYAHYLVHGQQEGRPLPNIPTEPRNRVIEVSGATAGAAAPESAFSIDAVIVAPDAGLLIIGWINDAVQTLKCIRIFAADWKIVLDDRLLMRIRREDVEKALGATRPHHYGFLAFAEFDRPVSSSTPLTIELWQGGAQVTARQYPATLMSAEDLRNTTLGYLAGAAYFGNQVTEGIGRLSSGVGDALLKLNATITRRLTATRYREQFGPSVAKPKGSIIVCLYGKPEYLFLQSCLFSNRPGIGDYEFIYVSNSPEIAEALLREARSSSLIYGLPMQVVILPGNAGFGAANNAAAAFANSDRLLIVNPDVFPHDPDWAEKHTAVLNGATASRTQLFGVPLYYDDGSLMHGGMYYEVQDLVTTSDCQPRSLRLCRTQHYGKGSPAGIAELVESRPVPGVTGAFISVARSWYERLGGFTEDFIFGHYEDADLCLKSLQQGVVPWIHDIRLWHLEGKGSVRRPAHEGGSLVNRWLFSRRWLGVIEDGLIGPDPVRLRAIER